MAPGAMHSWRGPVVLLLTRRIAAGVVATALVVTGLGQGASAERGPAPTPGERPRTSEAPDVARGLIVRTTTGSPSDAVVSAAGTALGAAGAVTDTGRLIPQISTVDFDQVVDGDVADAVAARLEQRDDVVWAIPNRLRRVTARAPVTTNDPLFRQQRNLWDAGAARRGGYSIKAPSLWRATKGSPSTVVAVIDTGITDHPDLAGRTVPGFDFISSPKRARDGDGRDADPTDKGDWNGSRECPDVGSARSSWHGTFVAGQIAASADNGKGIAGVAPGVVIQPIRALGRCGGWDSDLLDSMIWASGGSVAGVPANATPAPIVNLSLAGLASSSAERKAACRVFDAVARAGRKRGSLFIASAGNESDHANRAVPASCSEFVSVGATSAKGFSSIYSNVGSTVDLSAPGGDTIVGGRSDSIVSLGNAGRRSIGVHRYVRYEGTSMAAPQVAGAAALLHGLGFTSPGALRSALYASVSPFRARSGTQARKKIRIDGRTYRVDLNCSTRKRQWCGRGLLDLSRVQAPVSSPVIGGTPRVGEPLTASGVAWVSAPRAVTHTWRADGAIVGSGAVYVPTAADVGRQLTVTVSPASGIFARLAAVSAPTVPVPDSAA